MAECYSCGAEADPNSERNFCTDCDEIFENGLDRRRYVNERAQRLEDAKAQGDSEEVSRIMSEIFKES